MKRHLPEVLLALAVLAMLGTSPAVARERDPLAPVFDMEAPQFEAFPPKVIARENADAIVALVNEARLFGVPLAVRVVSAPAGHEFLPQLEDQDGTTAVPDETMREMAQAWMAEEPIESAPGAADGFLMLVIIPEDHTLSTAVIEPGPDALPLNGLTPANIDAVIQTHVMPSFADNRVSQGIRTGLSVFSYNNLFGKPERLELSELHQDLQVVAGVPLAGMTLAGALALVGFAIRLHRRDRTTYAAESALPLSPFSAAALREGRVNDAVVTGGLLELIRRGAVIPEATTLRIHDERATHVTDPFLGSILAIIRRNAGHDGRLFPAAYRRLHDLTGPARREMEDSLAGHGLYNRDAKVELMWLILGSGLLASLALFTLIPSVLGMARFGIAAIIIATIAITAVLTWAARRPWTTARGQVALEDWLRGASIEDQVAFDTIVNQDALISSVGGPLTPPAVNLVRSLRGVGAT